MVIRNFWFVLLFMYGSYSESQNRDKQAGELVKLQTIAIYSCKLQF